MRNIYFALTIVLSATIASCAETSITAFKDPAFASRVFQKPAIYVNSEDLTWRQSIEDTMVTELGKKGVIAVASMSLTPPTRTYSPEERAQVLAESDIDALIVIQIGDTGVETRYVPQTSTTTTTTGTATTYGENTTYQGQSHTTSSGGYNQSFPWAEMSTFVVDLASGQKAWIASSHTGGNAYASFNDIRTSYCKEIIRQLLTDGLLQNGVAPAAK